MSAALGGWWVWNRFVSLHAALYRASGGRIGGTYRGAPVLLLHHVGRKSGRYAHYQVRSSRDIPVIRLSPP